MYRLMQALISALRSPMRPSDFRAVQSVCVCVREGNALSGNHIQNTWHMQEQCHLQLNLTDAVWCASDHSKLSEDTKQIWKTCVRQDINVAFRQRKSLAWWQQDMHDSSVLSCAEFPSLKGVTSSTERARGLTKGNAKSH